MANNDENLVSEIKVTGGEESAKAIENYADRGSKAFEKLDAAAAKAGADVGKSTQQIGRAAENAQKSMTGLNNVDLSRFRDGVGKVQDSIGQLNSQMPKLTQAVGRFAQRMALLAAGAVAAGVGLAGAARNVMKAVDGQSDALEKNAQAQVDANNRALSAEEAQINLQSAYRKLQGQLARGEISYKQYSDAVLQLNRDYAEQQRVANEVANAQARVKEENDRLTKSVADRKAYQALIDTFGGPLVTSMTAFGRVAEQLRRQLIDAFGPALASLFDKVTQILNSNSGAITAFINTASAKLNELVSKNGPALEKFFTNIGKAAGSIALALIDAAPSIIDLFNNVLVPGVTKVAGLFNTLADAINLVFGTKLTGGSVFLVTIIAQMTGSIRLLFALLKGGKAVWGGFIGVLESVGELLLTVFGVKTAGQIAKFGGSIAKAGGPMKTFFAILKNGVPLIITFARVVGVTLGVGLGVSLPLVIAFGAALVYLATQVDWVAFANGVIDALKSIGAWLVTTWNNAKLTANGIRGAWQALVNWFAGIGTSIGSFFTNAWAMITAGATAAVALVQSAWQTIVDWFTTAVTAIQTFFTTLWTNITAGVSTAIVTIQAAWSAVVLWFQTTIVTPIATFFTTLWTNVTAGVAAAILAIQTAWNAIVAFFQQIGQQIQDGFRSVMDAIVAYWQAGFDKVKAFLSSLYQSALQYLKPIIDMLQQIIGLNAQADSGGGGGAGYARGGHITGPGTGTSDSIPLWGSNGEFMVKARSVAKYGLGMLNAINSGNFKIPGFASGGLVSIAPSPVPSFAGSGGEAGSVTLQPLNLSLFGEEFKGLMMPEDVGRRMTKFAINKQTRSAGRKPAWIGRGRT